MLDPWRPAAAVELDCDKIEAKLHSHPRMLAHPRSSRPPDPLTLPAPKRFGGSLDSALPRLHLYESDRIPFLRHDIQLEAAGSPVPIQHPVPASRQIFGRQPLAQ